MLAEGDAGLQRFLHVTFREREGMGFIWWFFFWGEWMWYIYICGISLLTRRKRNNCCQHFFRLPCCCHEFKHWTWTKTGPLLQKRRLNNLAYLLAYTMCSRLIQWGNIPNPWLSSNAGTVFLVSSFYDFFPQPESHNPSLSCHMWDAVQVWDRKWTRMASHSRKSRHEKRLSKMQLNDLNMNLGPQIL